jgi:antirestriction protein ArdC
LGKKRWPCCRPGQGLAPARTSPRFWPATALPPLIAAWLVGFMRTRKPRKEQAMKVDIYQRVTDQIVSELEKGVKPWLKPWNAAAGRITRPLRGNGIPYKGINVLMLWSAALEKANVRKGEHGSFVVYADKIVRTKTDTATGEEAERAIPFLKGYTVFNVEQIDGLPEHFYAKPAPHADTIERIERAEAFFAGIGADIRHDGLL